ncbi:hypothetical protein CU669_01335 [Paramagnetospirillum kuznetsovii]|uniref:Uncharacterized protein n=1 Tax=Paramagnetospirillum kuznetsovii TaxID=2053833 RepID=A0A364P3N1_9PROT|nr:hypothetical protein [Paramagnetospirillum kuznetsovii]RAU23767.1 hypothetical protein CU669_01335 [Paramagnetospirillum kuznetsovii]
MTIQTPILARTELLDLIHEAVAAHANVVQVRLDADKAVVETLAAGRVAASRDWSLDHCPQALASAFALCDGPDDYQYGSSRSGRMTGEKAELPKGVTMVFVQFFPPRDGQRHLVARITYDSDTCCGTCGG